MSKAAFRACLPVLLLLALAACSGADQSRSVSVAGTAANAEPSTENTTAVEKPQAPRQGNPGVQLASLPVGGTGPDSQGPDGVRCVTVNWSPSSDASALKEGYAVVVATVEVPAEYSQAEGGCAGPPCVGHIFRPSSLACEVSIRPSDASKTELGTKSKDLSMTGQVLCPDQGSALCKDFTARVDSDPRRVTVTLPVAPGSPSAPPDSNTGSTSGSATNAPPQATSAPPGG
jgi:hypothetical protein